MAKTWMIHDAPTPAQMPQAPRSGAQKVASAGTVYKGIPGPKAAKPKPKAKAPVANANTTSPLVNQARTLEKSSAMY